MVSFLVRFRQYILMYTKMLTIDQELIVDKNIANIKRDFRFQRDKTPYVDTFVLRTYKMKNG